MVLLVVGPVGEDDSGSPEGGGEEEGEDGEQEMAHHHSHPAREDPGLGQLQVQLVRRLHLVHPANGGELGHVGSLHHLGAGMQGNHQEWNNNRKRHTN